MDNSKITVTEFCSAIKSAIGRDKKLEEVFIACFAKKAEETKCR